MDVTGDGTVGTELIGAVDVVVQRLRRLAGTLGVVLNVVAEVELNRRMRLTGWRPNGRTSAGGSCQLLPTSDGQWVALNLARVDDVESLSALLGEGFAPRAGIVPWTEVARCVAGSAARDVRERAVELGLPVAILGEVDVGSELLEVGDRGEADETVDIRALKVIDLSSLWAGPLAGRLLADVGCRVVKVESSGRPDGARQGHPDFFASLNDGKEIVSVDFRSRAGADELRHMIEDADVVIEASRPRALMQLGIDRDEMFRSSSVRSWLSITAHGRRGDDAMRVGFGDDAAVAGGLVSETGDGPGFVGDAIADPITGLVGATAILESLISGRRRTIDVSLARAAARVAADARILSFSGGR